MTLQYDGSMVYIVFCAEICWRIFGQFTFPMAMQQYWDMCHVFGKGKLLVNKIHGYQYSFQWCLRISDQTYSQISFQCPTCTILAFSLRNLETPFKLKLKLAHISTNQKEPNKKKPVRPRWSSWQEPQGRGSRKKHWINSINQHVNDGKRNHTKKQKTPNLYDWLVQKFISIYCRKKL